MMVPVSNRRPAPIPRNADRVLTLVFADTEALLPGAAMQGPESVTHPPLPPVSRLNTAFAMLT